MRRGVAVAVTVALAPAACGAEDGTPTAGDPVARAAAASLGAGGVAVRVRGRAGRADWRIAIDGEGTFDTGRPRGRLRLTFPSPRGDAALDMRLLGHATYFRSDLLTARLPRGTRWLKLDRREAPHGVALELDRLSRPGGDDPAAVLRALRRARISRAVGRERIAGTLATHYVATLVDPAGRRAPVDVWIDASGRVRRVRKEVPMGPGQQLSLTIDYVRYGVPVRVRAPARAVSRP